MRVALRTAVVLLAVFCGAAVAGPVQWAVADGGNDHFYDLIFPEPTLNWLQARDAAAPTVFLGSIGRLATVTSAGENEFLRTTFGRQLKVQKFATANDQPGDFAFIGLTDAAVEGVYEWITGELYGYNDFGPFEPNNTGNQDYILVRVLDDGRIGNGPTWQWDTNFLLPTFGVDRLGYIVEFDGPFDAVPEPLTITLLVVALCAVRRRH